ncbi:uncharacterized protein LOC117787902 [Drosophila innubila]|uniref:uncharacterized protein LOC117787902 n=1 Tax=Drosophila innubila TaxID=198719 RepID=UPI00148BA4D0|nr:uncharacterized protein LOC117787902 [Drosophila innubila]
MNATYRNYRNYKIARRKFSIKTYLFLLLWLILALIQWVLINMLEPARNTFKDYYYICFVTFFLAILLFAIFIFFEKLRFINGVNIIVAFLIVELQVISLFALVAQVYLADLLIFFGICALLMVIVLIIGSILPRNIDLTLDVAVLFILGFIFLIIAIFLLMVQFVLPATSTSAYILFELFITTMILFFVMYHAQTIHGSRFAEMRLNDALLGSLILFHDFLIIYWLTFYWQFSFQTFQNLIAHTTNDDTSIEDNDGEFHHVIDDDDDNDGSEDGVTIKRVDYDEVPEGSGDATPESSDVAT